MKRLAVGPFRVLRHREYARLWCGYMLSDIGTWMQIAALGIFAVESTGQARWVGIVSTVTYLTSAFVFPLGGVIADRFDRRRVVIIAEVAQGLCSVGMYTAFVLGDGAMVWLVFLAGVQGMAFGFFLPAADSIIPDIVPAKDVHLTAAFSHVSWNVGRAFGPVVAVLALDFTTYGGVFLLNGVTYLVVALAMATIRSRPHIHVDTGSTYDRLRAGVEGLRGSRMCKWSIKLAVAEMALVAPYIALIPAFMQLSLSGTATDSAHVFLAQGIGSAAGVLVIASLVGRIGERNVMLLSLGGACIAGVAYAASPSVIGAIALVVPLSAFHTSALAVNRAIIQHHAPVRVRGRILGLSLSANNLAYAVGGSVMAPLADVTSLSGIFAVACIACLGFVVVSRTGGRRDHSAPVPQAAVTQAPVPQAAVPSAGVPNVTVP